LTSLVKEFGGDCADRLGILRLLRTGREAHIPSPLLASLLQLSKRNACCRLRLLRMNLGSLVRNQPSRQSGGSSVGRAKADTAIVTCRIPPRQVHSTGDVLKVTVTSLTDKLFPLLAITG
jgi:hypothetical protein